MLLTVVLGFVHVAFYVFLLCLFLVWGPLATFMGIAFGVLEITVSLAMSARSALAVIRAWLLAAGVLTIVFSVLCLTYLSVVVDYY